MMKGKTDIMRTLSVVVVLCAGAGFGAATPFPDADGSHDFSRPAAWGGALPSEAGFNADGAFTASEDVSFDSLSVYGGADVTFDLREQAGRKVAMTNGAMSFAGSGTKAQLLGGDWNMSKEFYVDTGTDNIGIVVSNATVSCSKNELFGTNNRMVFTGKDATFKSAYTGTYALFRGKGNAFVLTDGATWTHDANTLYLTINNAASNNVFRVEKNARFTTAKGFFAGYYEKEGSNRLEVADGGFFKASSLTIQRNGSSVLVSNATLQVSDHGGFKGTNNRLTLAGENARYLFTHTATFSLFGSGAPVNAELEVRDGAVWEFSSNNVYTTAANSGAPSNCVFRLADGGKFLSSKALYLGYSASEASNRVEILNGGEMKIRTVTIQREGQALDIDNGKLECTGGSYTFASGSHGCRISVAGANSSIGFASMDSKMFDYGSDHLIRIADGATWEYKTDGTGDYYTSVNNSSHHNTVRVERGGRLLAKNGFHVGWSKDSSNRVEVLSGGSIVAPSIYLGGLENELVVSNGFVSATNATMDIGISTGDFDRYGTLVVAGTNSQLRTAGSLTVCKGTTLRFNLPSEGYVSVPFVAKGSVNVNLTTTIEVEAEAFQQALSRHANVVLIKGEGTFYVSPSVLEATNRKIAEKHMRLYVKDNKLILSVTAVNAGTLLIVR